MLRKTRRGLELVLIIGLLGSSVDLPLSGQSATARQQEKAREGWQRVPEIFEAMRIGPGAVVADVGAREGFLTVRLAGVVGSSGRVFAIDIDEAALEQLHARIQQDELTNVTVVKGDTDDPHLAAASLDAAVIVNSYHEMTEHQAMLRHLRAALKPHGRLVIVEPISENLRNAARARQEYEHEIAAPFVEQDVRDAGFRVETLRDPFITRSSGVSESLVVAVVASTATSDVASAPTDDESAIASRSLRITFDEFKQRRADKSIAVIDVRSEEEFVAGHVPGAIWIQLSDVNSRIEQLRALRKPIVTYCS